jgi:hypothetical protein
METKHAFKKDLLVWTIIVSLFAMLTLISVNADQIRESAVFYKERSGTQAASKGLRTEIPDQPGYSVVLAQ